MVTAKDTAGVVHEVAVDDTIAACGVRVIRHYNEGAGPVTCLECSTDCLKNCGHKDAVIRNCPYKADVDNDPDARCRCCDNCAYECQQDI